MAGCLVSIEKGEDMMTMKDVHPGAERILPSDAKTIALQKGWIKIDDEFINLNNVTNIATSLNWHGLASGAKCVIFFNDGRSLTVRGQDARQVAAMMEDIVEQQDVDQALAMEQNGKEPQVQLIVDSLEVMDRITQRAEIVRRLDCHLRTTWGISFLIRSDFTVQAFLKGLPVGLSDQTDGIFAFEEFLDWAFTQPILERDDE